MYAIENNILLFPFYSFREKNIEADLLSKKKKETFMLYVNQIILIRRLNKPTLIILNYLIYNFNNLINRLL